MEMLRANGLIARVPFGIIGLCVATMAMLWTVLLIDADRSERAATDKARNDTSNLAMAFRENVRRTIGAIDQLMITIITENNESGSEYHIPTWIENSPVLRGISLQVAISGPDGVIVASTLGVARRNDVSDREAFRYHLNPSASQPYISAPIIGRSTGQLSIQITRRITRTDGSFGGTIDVAIDPFYFSQFFDEVGLGPNGVVDLVGRDGIVRARRALNNRNIGQNVGDTPLFKRMLVSSSGSEIVRSKLDGITRVYGYSSVPDYPLVVAVGIAMNDVLAAANRRWVSNIAIGGGLTVIFVALSWFIARETNGRRQRELAAHIEEKVREHKLVLDSALNNMRDGGVFSGKAIVKRSHTGRHLFFLATVPVGIIALSALIAVGIPIPNVPAVLLLAVVYSGYRGGPFVGLANAGMQVLYAAIFFSEPHDYFSYDSQSLARVLVFVIVSPTTAALVGLLKHQADQYKQINENARWKAERAVEGYAEREQHFIAAVKSSNDAIVTESLDGVITGWNEAAEHLFGYTAQEALGKRTDIIVPVDLRHEGRAILVKIKNGEKVDHHETVRINKDGQRIDVSLGVSPVKSQTGVIIGAAKVARDIKVRKKAQEALLESEQMARAIVDTALDAFLQLDESGTIIGWSPKAETMFGWSGEEVVGQKVRDLIVPTVNRDAHSERIAQFVRDAENGSPGRRYESTSLRRDGTEIKTEVSLTALRRRDGYIINAFLRDVTERAAAEEQLKQAQKMESVGQLTGGIAHDFNNMLTAITGTIDILADAVADNPRLAAIAGLISEAADRGAELTSHLLAFARKQPLQPGKTDLNALMIDSVKLLRPALGARIEIEAILKPDVWPALVDPSQLSSGLMNLAINARDAMPNGGKLTLETSNVVLDQDYARNNADVQSGDYVLIAVSDTGGGIPEAIREKIFEPFFTTKDVGKGTGLGLSMVYGFVKQSNGHIKVYSEERHGTTFKIYLPRASAHADRIAAPSSDSHVEGGTETILVVEDDAIVRTAAITQLQSLGYETLSATNAAEALAIADGGAQFDLLFTDVIMPGKINGRQLAEEMAKRRSPLKVLFTSGYTEDAIIHHGRLDPGVLLLAKPYRKLELARMLRTALDAANALPVQDAEPLKSQAI
jgi:PAS domain S-box-containing protein